MSKFCGNCGTVMDDAATVCGNCGAPLTEQEAPAAKKGGKFDVKAALGKVTGIISSIKSGDKNSIVKGGIVLVAAVVILVLIISLFSAPGYERVAKKVIKAIDKDKPESIVKLIPEFRFGDVEEGSWQSEMDEGDWEDDIKDEFDDYKEFMDEAIGSEEYSIKYDIVDVDVYGEDHLKDIEESYEAYEDFEDKKLKKAVSMTIEATFKKGGEKHDVNISVVAVKYGGKWYLHSYYMSPNAVTNDKYVD